MYWVESNVDSIKTEHNAQKKVVIKHLCARSGYNAYIRLSTNLKQVEPNGYVLYNARTAARLPVSVPVCEFTEDEQLVKQRFDSFLGTVQVLSSGQGLFIFTIHLSDLNTYSIGNDAIWRELRMFKITSTVSAHLLSYYHKTTIPKDVVGTQGAKLKFQKVMNLLCGEARDLEFEIDCVDDAASKRQQLQASLKTMSRPELVEKCKQLGVAKSGNKSALIERMLLKYDKVGHTEGEDEEDWDIPIPGHDASHFIMRCLGAWFLTKFKESEFNSALKIGRRAEPITISNLPTFLAEHSNLKVMKSIEVTHIHLFCGL